MALSDRLIDYANAVGNDVGGLKGASTQHGNDIASLSGTVAFIGASFASRAALAAAVVPPNVDEVSYTLNGVRTAYIRDATTAFPAAVTQDGTKWVPSLAMVTPDHWGENTSPGSTDMSAATQAALNFINEKDSNFFSSGATLTFNAIKYVLQNVQIKTSGVNLSGAARGGTQIINTSRGANTFTVAGANPKVDKVERVAFRELMMFNTSSNPNAGAHISARRARITVDSCELINHFRGVELLATGESCRIINTEITQGSNTTGAWGGRAGIFIGRAEVDATDPTGILDSTDGLKYGEPNSVFIDNCNVRSGTWGMEACISMDAVDGLYCTNSHLGFAYNAIVLMAPRQNNISFANINFIGVFLDPKPGTTGYGFRHSDLYGVGKSVAGDITISDCIIGAPDIDGMFMSASCARLSVTGCNIKGCGRYGILLNNADITNVVITNNRFWDCDKDNLGTVATIYVAFGTAINIHNNDLDLGGRGIHITANVVSCKVYHNTISRHSDEAIYVNEPASSAIDVGKNFLGGAYQNGSPVGGVLDCPLGHEVMRITGGTVNSIRSTSPTQSLTGREITLIAAAAVTVNHNAGNIILRGGTYSMTAGATLRLLCTFGTWYEVSRA